MAQGKKTTDIEGEFWSKVQQKEGCWIWLAGKRGPGYGVMTINNKAHAAHRLSYELTNGPIPKSEIVRHTCDNPSCVNPAHLVLGTHTQNMQDMIDRGRHKNQQKTHCKKGHPLIAGNLANTSKNLRICLICKRAKRTDMTPEQKAIRAAKEKERRHSKK